MKIIINNIYKHYKILGIEPNKHGTGTHKNDIFYIGQCIDCNYIRQGDEAIRSDYLNPNDKKTVPCPQCGKKWKVNGVPDLTIGAIYNNCTIIKDTEIDVPKRGHIFQLQDNKTKEKFYRYSFDLRDGYKWHSPNAIVASTSILAEEGRAVLKKSNIIFSSEQTFNDLRAESGRSYSFDVYCPKINTIIEFDGQQHYKNYQSGIFKDKLEEIQKSDKIKEEWCKKHNVNLIRIPYWKEGQICIEDMMPFLSKFHIIKNYKCY